jgi:transposase-like protein
MQRRKFSREFKLEAVRLVCERGGLDHFAAGRGPAFAPWVRPGRAAQARKAGTGHARLRRAGPDFLSIKWKRGDA